jgi:hypothetical protein
MNRIIFKVSLVVAATTLMALQVNGWGWLLGFLLVEMLTEVEIRN